MMRAVLASLVACVLGLSSPVPASAAPPGRVAVNEPQPPGGIASEEAPGPGSEFERARRPARASRDHVYELGGRIRYLFVTRLMLSPYLFTATDMNSVSAAIEFAYRKPDFDVVTSLDYSAVMFADGNFLAVNHPADLDTHYLQFRGLGFLSVDVSLLGHRWLTPWMELRGGAGLGLGVVLGDILSTNNGSQCTLANAADPSKCYPVGVGPLTPGSAASEAKLAATEDPKALDTAATPHRHPAWKPPVMGVLNVVLGLRFKVARHALIGWDIGFRNALFTGLSGSYLF